MSIHTYYPNGTASLLSTELTPNVPKCLSFWYYIHGILIKSFTVYQNALVISSIDVGQQSKWIRHFVRINDSKQYRINLQAVFGSCNTTSCSYPRFILVDDFTEADRFCQESSIFPTAVDTTTGLRDGTATSSNTTGLQDSTATSSHTTGIIVGVVFGIGFIVGLVTFLLWFIRRAKSVPKKSASRDNQMLSNDYTGHPSVALPALPNPMSNNDGYTDIHTKKDNYQHVNSKLQKSISKSGLNYEKLDQLNNVSDNKAKSSQHASGDTNHDYIYFDDTGAGITQTSIYDPDVKMLNKEIHKGNEYAVIDPNNDYPSGNNQHITRGLPPPGNYAILDPNETGFFRSKGNNDTTSDYDFAVPINDNKKVSDLHDLYSVSDNGTYDSSGNVCHMKTHTNIYSHAVENEYDTSLLQRKIMDDNDTYDHFFGDETEDNYNITKRE